MPSAKLSNRHAVEAALYSDTELIDAIDVILARLGNNRRGWQNVRPLAQLFEQLAARGLMDEATARGVEPGPALQSAADVLEVPVTTLASRLNRWREWSQRKTPTHSALKSGDVDAHCSD